MNEKYRSRKFLFGLLIFAATTWFGVDGKMDGEQMMKVYFVLYAAYSTVNYLEEKYQTDVAFGRNKGNDS